MAQRYDNPFEEGDEVNPFSKQGNRGSSAGTSAYAGGPFFTQQGVSNSRLSPLPHEDFYNDRSATVDIPLESNEQLRRREKDLQAREAEVAKRERELKRREDAAARAGIVVEQRNWPPFLPIIHHDIANDIPIHLHRQQYIVFASLLGLVICLFWNLICATAALITGQGATIWFLAVIFFLSGCPLAYLLWYRPLYRAVRNDSATKFGMFFAFYIIHIIFCAYAVVSPPTGVDMSLTGIFPAIGIIGKNIIIGIFYFIGFALFCIELLISIYSIQQVYAYFRKSGKDTQLTREAARGAMRAAI